MPKRRRVIVWGMAAVACVVLATAAAGLAVLTLLGTTPARVWAEASARTPNEVIRYLKRRLEGHPRLEAVLLPPLHAAQRRIEREPPPGPLPDLGKGQRPEPLAPVRGLTQTLRVDTPQAIREALLQATPGTQIVIAPGLYPFSTKLRLGQDGRMDAPIALRAERPGTVFLAFSQVEGVLVDKPHWVFENLQIQGECRAHSDCEHAFHVVGRGHHTAIRNNHISDFNAHIKVNGLEGDWPDHGELRHNTLTNQGVRQTHNPVALLDLVGASHWRVADNHVTNFIKGSGNQVSYGLFMKGAGEGGRVERNLVVCTPSGISQPGARIGISFGGGTTDPAACRVAGCARGEHFRGVATHNVVAHCNDVGLDVNRSVDIDLRQNTLINTAGIGVRHAVSSARVAGNLLEGQVVGRDGARVSELDNETMEASAQLRDADRLDLRWREAPATVQISEEDHEDFSGEQRDSADAPGAIRRR